MSKTRTLDVIITSTCRKTIKPTLESFFDNVHFSGKFRFIIHVDIINDRSLKYYKKVLTEYNIKDVIYNHPPYKGHIAHANAIQHLIPMVKTPFYFHLEDDWVFKKHIDLDKLITLMQSHNGIHHIRFNKETVKDSTWLYHLNDTDTPSFRKKNKSSTIGGVDLVKTYVWSFNPSIARTTVAKSLLPVPAKPPLGPNPEKTFCHRFDKLYRSEGAYILGQIGDSARVKDIGRNKYREAWRIIKKKIKTRFGPKHSIVSS